jgi:hypothetical protein
MQAKMENRTSPMDLRLSGPPARDPVPRPRSKALLAGLVLAFLPGSLPLRATAPTISLILPRSAQRGTEVDIVLHGARLGDAQELLFYQPGIRVVSLDATNAAQLKARLSIATNAPLGAHVFRVRTAGGLSEARTFSVGPYPVVAEREPNDDFANPQLIALNSTVHGIAGNEDIDYYRLEARKGQRIVAEVEAMRLGSALVDCHVAILNAKRFELAAADDSAFALQDPVAATIAPEDGLYVIAVRESSFAGRDDSRYCLHVGEGPRPLVAYPPGGRAGETVPIRFLGDVRGDIAESVALPAQPVGDFDYSLIQDGRLTPSPNRLRVVPFGNLLETEPNNRPAEATNAPADLPIACNGILASPGDIDFFRFRAKAGQKYAVRCVARAIRSPLDSVLTLHKPDGAALADNDDAGGPDSRMDWTVPADGEYLVSVRDHLGQGGPVYVYRVEFAPDIPELTLALPEFARNSQERNSVPVPRGNRFATLVRVTRTGFGGDVALGAADLPPGMTMLCDPIVGSVNEVPVVFEAAPDAALAGKLVSLVGRPTAQTNIAGEFHQRLELVYGEPNNTVYYQTTVDRLAVAVTEEVPFRIAIRAPKVPLVQSGSTQLKVLAERLNDFKAPIRLSLLWTPPGLGAQNEVVLGEGQTAAQFPLNAAADAPPRAWPIVLLATADTPKGPAWAASPPVRLTVAPPFLALQIPLAAGEQGQTVPVLCKLQQLQPFDGTAQVQLFGLPPKVDLVQNPLAITATNLDSVFTAKLAPDAPIGQHKSLFAQVVITRDGEPIAHNLGAGGVLRIDAPPPPKPNPPPAVAQAAPAPAPLPKPEPPKGAPPPKPLSRLEKLRLESRDRAPSGAR